MSARGEYYVNEFRVFLKHCRWSCGCSSVVAGIVFAVFFIGLAFGRAPWADNALISATFAVSFLSVLFCWGMYGLGKDDVHQKVTRAKLMNEQSVSDQQFVQLRPTQNAAMLLEVRKRIAREFSVPVIKISRDIHLVDYIKWDRCIDAASWIVFEKRKVGYEESVEVTDELDKANSLDELADKLETIVSKHGSNGQSL